MSAEDVAVVRNWMDGLRAGDVRPEICDPEIEIRNWDEAPDPGPYHGIEGLHQWWGDVESAFDNMHFELIDVVDCGGGVTVTSQRIVGRFRLTGIDLDHTWGSIITVKDGRIASARGYMTPDQARRAAGAESG